jgi:MoaA/NifB/PqqE/SkfB family radical SAM enzyme
MDKGMERNVDRAVSDLMKALGEGKGRITLKQLEELAKSCRERNIKSIKVGVVQKTGEGKGTYRSPHVTKTKHVDDVAIYNATPAFAGRRKPEVLELSITLKPDRE